MAEDVLQWPHANRVEAEHAAPCLEIRVLALRRECALESPGGGIGACGVASDAGWDCVVNPRLAAACVASTLLASVGVARALYPLKAREPSAAVFALSRLRGLRLLGFQRPAGVPLHSIAGTYVSRRDRDDWDVTLRAAGALFTYEALPRNGSKPAEVGVGLLRDGHLFVAVPPLWGGIAIYRFSTDGAAHGLWTASPPTPPQPELSMLGEAELDASRLGTVLGDHAWRSRAPGQSGPLVDARYPLDITASGDALHLEWSPGMEGVGLQRGPWLGAVWGTARRPMALIDYDFSGTDLCGVRVVLGRREQSVEHLERTH